MRKGYFTRIFLILSVFSFLMTIGYVDTTDARRRRGRPRRAKIINEKKLFERLGGIKVVGEVVDEWMRLSIGDDRLAGKVSGLASDPKSFKGFRSSVSDQLCELTDGPCRANNSGATWASKKFELDEIQYFSLSENLFKAMKKMEIPEREINETMARWGDLKSELILEKGNT